MTVYQKDCILQVALLLALVVGLNSQILVITDAPQTFQCLNISEIEICSQIGWHMGSFPNFREQQSIAEANQELYSLLPLIQTGCSEAIVHMLCAVYASPCDSDFPHIRLPPCKELCVPVRESCEDDLLRMGTSWPPVLECDQYPSIKDNRLAYCVDDVSALRIPDNIMVNRITTPTEEVTTTKITTMAPLDPCATLRCRNGYTCKVHPPTGEGFCEPSCDLNNGGCSPGTHCILRDDTDCTAGGPCPPLRSCCPHPRCDMNFCSARRTRRALCTMPHKSESCDSDNECPVTFCHACYFSQIERTLPGNCGDSCSDYTSSNRCSRRWATCVRRAYPVAYGKPAWPRRRQRVGANFLCYSPPCVQN